MHFLPVPMGENTELHTERQRVSLCPPAVTLPERPLTGGQGPRFIPPHQHESLWRSLAGLLAGCQCPYLPNGNLLTGKDLDCFGKPSQESIEAGWISGSNRLTRENLRGKDLTS